MALGVEVGGGQILGLIAGAGAFPLEIARSVRRRRRAVAAIAFCEHTDPEIEAEASRVTWLRAGELAPALAALREARVREAVMAGALPKAQLFSEGAERRLDARAARLVAGLADRRDASILAALADALQREGIRLLPQGELVPELLAGEGPLGAHRPTPEQDADIAFAWPLARTVAGLDVGQTLVVKDRTVLAVEALEGTDAAIRRGGALAAGATVVKVARPGQDPRFDLPAIGAGTLAAMIVARAAALAFEAGRTVVLERAALVEAADAQGIALLGVRSEGPPRAGT